MTELSNSNFKDNDRVELSGYFEVFTLDLNDAKGRRQELEELLEEIEGEASE